VNVSTEGANNVTIQGTNTALPQMMGDNQIKSRVREHSREKYCSSMNVINVWFFYARGIIEPGRPTDNLQTLELKDQMK
jgi:hypothetical protein